MNRPKTIDGTPVRTSTEKRTTLAKRLALPYSTSQTATPIPIGMAIAEAIATISRVPRIALRMPPIETFSKKLAPVGSEVKKLPLHEPRPFWRR